MAGRGKQRDERAAHERARVYAARREFHDGRARRRTRDNLVAGIGGGVLLLAVLGAQTAYFTLGPGAPEPQPAVTDVPTPTSTTDLSPTPTPSAPTAEPTPSPTS